METWSVLLGRVRRSAWAFCIGILTCSQAFALPSTATNLTILPSGSVSVGTVLTLTASVTSAGANVTRGLVIFCNAAAAHCEDSAILGQAQLTSGGSAILKLRLGSGAHSIRASFQGTTLLAASQSTAGSLTVTASPSSTTVTALGTPGAVTLTGMANFFGPVTPSGTLSFLDAAHGNALLGSAAIDAAVTTAGFTEVLGPSLDSYQGSIAVGDFNGDGIPDYAIPNLNANTVGVYLGIGDGTFNLKSSPATGDGPWAAGSGDFNGDGIADLAIVSFDNTLTILLGNGDGTFVSKSSPSPGNISPGIAIGDFNGDGIPDIATVNEFGNDVTVLLGNGDGTFALKASPATGQSPQTIVAGDLNGDGILDLVTANEGDSTITVLLGNGDGTFTGKSSPSSDNVDAAALGDFNGDGIPDLVVGGASIVVLLGKGDGTFVEKTTATGLGTTFAVSVGDFNGDGVTDIAALGGYVLFGKGDGTFPSMVSFSFPASSETIVVADVNGDGLSDIITANYDESNTFLAQQTSTVSVNSPLSAGTYQIVASYSGSANYAASSSQPFLLVLDQPADPVFNPPPGIYQWTQSVGLTDATPATVIHYTNDGTTPTSSSPAYTSPITISWDGSIKAVAVLASGAYSNVVTGTYAIDRPLPPPTFSPPSGTYPPSQLISLIDDPAYCGQHGAICVIYYTLDGTTPTTSSKKYTRPIAANSQGATTIQAIATSHHFTSSSIASATYIYAHAPTSTTLAISPSDSVSAGTVVTLTASVTSAGADVTRGLVIFCNAAAAHCEDSAILGQAQLTSSGSAKLKLRLGAGAHSIRAWFQGTTLLATSQSATGSLTVTTSSYATTAAVTASATAGGSNPLAIPVLMSASINFIGTATPGGTVSFLDAAHGNALFGSTAITSGSATNGFATFLGPFPGQGQVTEALAVGDFNGDGIPDLAIPNASANEVQVYSGTGDGTFTLKSSIGVTNAPWVAATGDFNGDGIADLATLDLSNSSLTILLGNGDGTFVNRSSQATGNYPQAMAIGDFNNDGIPDIATANARDNTVTVLLGNGDGTFDVKSSPATGGFPATISTADLNGDGRLDLIVLNQGDHSLTILLGNGDGTFTNQSSASLGDGGAAIADFNSDGIPDLVLTEYRGEESVITILLGKGDGTFMSSTSLSVASPLVSVSVGDFNGDGITDIAAEADTNLLVYFGNAEGGFGNTEGGITYPVNLPINGSFSAAVGDFNGDGSADIVALALCKYSGCNVPGFNSDGLSPGDYYVTVFLGALTAPVQLLTTLPGGAYQIVASYLGNSDYTTSNSPPLALVLNPPADPVFTPLPGMYQWTQQITLTDATAGAVIHYTLDGTPATPSSPVYTSPIVIGWDGTINATAVAASGAYGNVVTGTYTIDRPLPPPTFSLPSGTYNAPQSITLIDDPTYCGQHGVVCEIYYTLNGETPTTWGSPVYTGPIVLDAAGTKTIKAIASSHHSVPSNVASATYTLH